MVKTQKPTSHGERNVSPLTTSPRSPVRYVAATLRPAPLAAGTSAQRAVLVVPLQPRVDLPLRIGQRLLRRLLEQVDLLARDVDQALRFAVDRRLVTRGRVG